MSELDPPAFLVFRDSIYYQPLPFSSLVYVSISNSNVSFGFLVLTSFLGSSGFFLGLPRFLMTISSFLTSSLGSPTVSISYIIFILLRSVSFKPFPLSINSKYCSCSSVMCLYIFSMFLGVYHFMMFIKVLNSSSDIFGFLTAFTFLSFSLKLLFEPARLNLLLAVSN